MNSSNICELICSISDQQKMSGLTNKCKSLKRRRAGTPKTYDRMPRFPLRRLSTGNLQGQVAWETANGQVAASRIVKPVAEDAAGTEEGQLTAPPSDAPDKEPMDVEDDNGPIPLEQLLQEEEALVQQRRFQERARVCQQLWRIRASEARARDEILRNQQLLDEEMESRALEAEAIESRRRAAELLEQANEKLRNAETVRRKIEVLRFQVAYEQQKMERERKKASDARREAEAQRNMAAEMRERAEAIVRRDEDLERRCDEAINQVRQAGLVREPAQVPLLQAPALQAPVVQAPALVPVDEPARNVVIDVIQLSDDEDVDVGGVGEVRVVREVREYDLLWEPPAADGVSYAYVAPYRHEGPVKDIDVSRLYRPPPAPKDVVRDCSICYDEAQGVVVPCGHQLCIKCAITVRAKRGERDAEGKVFDGGANRCPICKGGDYDLQGRLIFVRNY
jgi:Zinc finger, C3HC4 type (RING finger)